MACLSGLMCLVLGTAVLAAEPAQLVQVTPNRAGNLVVCGLRTVGLPGEKQLQSMRSGLVSAVELDLALLDENDKLLATNSISLRMAFDLWDEVFSVSGDGRERRFQSLADLQAYLADLVGVPVAPTEVMPDDGRVRIKVGLVVHAIAPDEQQRVEDVIVGQQRRPREGQDRQEASVSLGRLMRLFYKGGSEGEQGQQSLSRWFTSKELPDATD